MRAVISHRRRMSQDLGLNGAFLSKWWAEDVIHVLRAKGILLSGDTTKRRVFTERFLLVYFTQCPAGYPAFRLKIEFHKQAVRCTVSDVIVWGIYRLDR